MSNPTPTEVCPSYANLIQIWAQRLLDLGNRMIDSGNRRIETGSRLIRQGAGQAPA